MTKKKGIASKLFIGLTGLTLLSCCFLGTTFARYTSGGEGKAQVGVALWDVDFASDSRALRDDYQVNFAELSPSMDEWSGTEEDEQRKNPTARTLVGVIQNKSQVSAKVAFSFEEAETKYVFNGAAKFDESVGFDVSDLENTITGNPTEAQVDELFEITVSYDVGEGVQEYTPGTTEITLGSGGFVYFYMTITWASADVYGETYADALDTWVGINIATVNYNISFSAVQASELP